MDAAGARPEPGSDDRYAMGRTSAERDRLSVQDRLYRPHSEHLARFAGIGTGMRVLDVGCGVGATMAMLAELVGPTGAVIGVDQDADALAVARRKIDEQGWPNVTLHHGELDDLALDSPVDALFGRLILMHLDDPGAVVGRLVRLVRPGGLVMFQEVNNSAVRSVPNVPAWTTLQGWVTASLRHVNRDPDTGDLLPGIFAAAGLPASHAVAFQVGDNADSAMPDFAEQSMHSLASLIVASGAATDAEVRAVDRDDFADQAHERGAVLYAPDLVAAWTTVPAG